MAASEVSASAEVVPLTRAEKVFTLTGVLLGLLLAALDQTIVATAGPAIQADLHIEASLYAWLTTAYLVTSTMMVPIYGKLSDLLGRRPILVAGILIFLAGSFLCGVSNTTTHVILARALQGVGSAALFTSAFAVVADVFPPRERGRYQGIFGGVFGLSSVVGPLAGGFITDHFGWHWVFFVNLPLGAVALAFIFLKMPALKRHREAGIRVDIEGSVVLLVAVIPLLLALSLGKREVHPGETGFVWGSWQILGMFALSAVATVLFVFVERRAKEPILDLGLFRNRTFAVSNLAAFIVGSAFLAGIVFLPLFMVNVVGLTNTSSGLTVTPLTLGLVFGNVMSGQIVARVGKYKALLLLSMVLLAVGYAVMGWTLTPHSTQWEVTLKMIVVGVGLGPAIPIYTLVTQNAVQPNQMGVATSTVTFFRQLGSTVGVAVFGTVFGAALASGVPARLEKALANAPPQMKQRFLERAGAGGGGAGAGEEGATAAGMTAFPTARIKDELRQQFASARAHLQKAPPEDRGAQRELAGLQTAEQRALETVDGMELAVKQAFTDAISLIYRFAVLIALLAFLVTVFLPELPLRAGHGHKPPVVME